MSQEDPTPCSRSDCDQPAKTRGMCKKHYHKWWRDQNREQYREKQRQYAADNAERISEYQRQRYLANRERILAREAEKYGTPEYRERKKAAARRYRLENLEADRLRSRQWRIKNVYGMTIEEYDEKMAGGCAICGSTKGRVVGKRNPNETPPPPRLCMDHDSKTGKVRGVLCHNCNSGLGLFNHDPALLRAAADYLERHQ